jgi:hypothetical protein
MPELIGPDGLEPDCVVPQCLDNQFIPDRIFADMIGRGVDYLDETVAAAREQAFRTEFIRSLTYSSQIVIQRASMKNSHFLYKNYLPEDRKNLNAFAELIREHAIVPYLWKETSLAAEQNFEVIDDGDRSMKALLREVADDGRCVRLAIDDADNDNATDIMAGDFGEGLTHLNSLSRAQRNAMASELFSDPGALQQEGAWEEFESAIDAVAGYAFNKTAELRRADKRLMRQGVYEDLFAAGDDENRRKRNVALGRFKAPGPANPFLLELKKYVDLVYNVNLPDHLKRYTFTPVNMPSRMALQDRPGKGYTHEQISNLAANPDALEWIRRSFMARTQTAMSLPLLSELSVADVVAIRQFPEWEAFKDAQQKILKDPLHYLDSLEPFQKSFDQFQLALSEWYNRTHERKRTEARYCNFVTLALSVGGVLAVAGSNLAAVPHDVGALAAPEIAARLPRRVKGYAAKLLVGVYDTGKHRLDAERSYTIELMQTSEELTREDVAELLSAVDRAEDALPSVTGLVADQGIQ